MVEKVDDRGGEQQWRRLTVAGSGDGERLEGWRRWRGGGGGEVGWKWRWVLGFEV
ncbi:hypothetical protein HanRHA438_Chr06g0254531 [Helianthus annuus]|nr:hypothetical protein HanRHA438_Chr06g0254531 [Helianthus annuus]